MDDTERLQRRKMISALRTVISTVQKDEPDPEDAQNRRREALVSFMTAHNLNANSWALDAGVRPTSVYNFIKGHSKSLDDTTYEDLAAAMNVTPATIMGEPDYSPAVGQALVIGRVQAGQWQEVPTFVDEADATVIPCVLPPNMAAKGTRAPVFGLSVVGDSMDQVFSEGTILICLPINEMGVDVTDGDFVIVHRKHADGTYEATCKEFRLVDGVTWLAPKSSNPAHMPIKTEPEDGVEVQVAAIVFGHYSPMAVANRL